jgi:hypothetical protein
MPLGSFDPYLLYRDLKGLAGFASDIVAIARMEFRNPHGLTKFYAIDKLRRRTDADSFIEAGTSTGTTAARCARVFKRVFTIELDPCAAGAARAFLSRHSNVTVLEGDAQTLLPDVMRDHDLDRAIVFLDGHAPLGAPPNGVAPEPALELVDALSAFRQRICGIIVDDFRNFGAAPGFPARSCLLKTAEDFCAGGDFVFDVQLDQLVIARLQH